jgi:hypothetical protein
VLPDLPAPTLCPSLSITVEVLAVADRPKLGVGASPSPASPESSVIKRRDEAVKLAGADMDRLRAAVRWLNLHGNPDATLKGLLTRVALEEVRRLEVELNNGEPFGDARALPRGGRVQPQHHAGADGPGRDPGVEEPVRLYRFTGALRLEPSDSDPLEADLCQAEVLHLPAAPPPPGQRPG